MTAQPVVVLPIGHDLGPQYVGGTASGYRYRVFDGAEVHELDDEQYAVWSAATGEVASTAAAWTPELPLAAAQRFGVHDARSVLIELMERGLIAQVRIGTDEAIRFAVLHRIEARMLLLGPSADLVGGARAAWSSSMRHTCCRGRPVPAAISARRRST